MKKSDGAGTVMIVGTHFEHITTTNQSTSYYLLGSQRVAMRVAGAVHWLHGDHLGSASLTTSITGTKVAELRYRPFGETRWAWGTTPTDRRYTGQREVPAIGLYDYNARMYWPAAGRFVSADTIVPGPGKPQALNRYSYVRNSPLMRVDPDGHSDCDAGDSQCWIDQYIARANWYRQSLKFRWLEDTRLTDAQKARVEAFYKNMLDDPAGFASRYLDAPAFGRSDESTYLMLLSTETSLSNQHGSPDQLVYAVLQDAFGREAANAALSARQWNVDHPYEQVSLQSTAQAAGVVVGGTKLVFDTLRHMRRAFSTHGWTVQSLQTTIANPADTALWVNKATGNPAMIYYRGDGNYVVVDTVTREIIHVSKIGQPGWIDPLGEPLRNRR